MTTKKYICPVCKQKTGVEILYGLPLFKMHEASERGEIVLGGCIDSHNSPERACTSCGHEWRIKRKVYFDESLS